MIKGGLVKEQADRGGGWADGLRARVLCVAAHPDDEVMGAAGTLSLHAEAGGEVAILVLSEGEAEKLPGAPRCEDRRACTRAAADVVGASEVIFADLPDQRFDAVPFIDVIKPIEAAVRELSPHIVYTLHRGDANTDHQVAFKATYAACRAMSAMARSVRKILCYEAPSSTEQAPAFPEYQFLPNVYVDILPTWEKKLQALQCYPTELCEWPHPRSLPYFDALSIKRGAEGGFSRAEAFALVRESITAAPLTES